MINVGEYQMKEPALVNVERLCREERPDNWAFS